MASKKEIAFLWDESFLEKDDVGIKGVVSGNK
jgi:hypothetical protein